MNRKVSGRRLRRRIRLISVGASASIAIFGLSGLAIGDASAAASSGSTTIMLEGAITGPVYQLPEMVTGAQAAVNMVNAEGGVLGKKIKLITCSDQGNPNDAAACAREAVSDHVSAVVGGLSIYDPYFLPQLKSAHIPEIGATDINTVDHTSPVSFPTGQAAVDYAAAGALLAQHGCKQLAIIYNTQPGSKQNASVIGPAFKYFGGKSVTDTTYSNSVTNFSPVVATAEASFTGGSTPCMQLITGGQQTPEAITAVRSSSDPNLMLGINVNGVSNSLLTPLHLPSGQLLATANYYLPGTPGKPAVNKFVSNMKKTDPGADVDMLAENAYNSVLIYKLAAEKAGSTSSSSILHAMHKLTNVNTGLMTVTDFGLKAGPLPGYTDDRDAVDVAYSWTGSGFKEIGHPINVTPIFKHS